MGTPGTVNSGPVQQHMCAMENLASTRPSLAANANANGNVNVGGSAALMLPSLKKLKREAAQRRKAQARTLKLRAEEQERLQRLEIDALVEQQRLQRLERQRCEEDARQLKSVGADTAGSGPASSTHGHPSQGTLHSIHSTHLSLPVCTSTSSLPQAYQQQLNAQASCNSMPRDNLHHPRLNRGSKTAVGATSGDQHTAIVTATARNSDQAAGPASMVAQTAAHSKGLPGKGINKDGGWRGNKETQRAKQAQQQSMRAAVESRRRLARGPRSGAVTDTHPMLPLEDHRVVSTEYQAAGTQALMRVTLLAAGFVIGARGISARLIGQVTGAIVQSWTESCRSDSIPIRLFRIQGKKAIVQAAAALIEQAVVKYKELCDCKRRGEFVQREHVINGVEFYYQPPPRKAFVVNLDGCCGSGIAASSPNSCEGGNDVGNVEGNSLADAVAQAQAQLSFNTHHVWLQHLHAQQQHDHMVSAQLTSNQGPKLRQMMHNHSQGPSGLLSHDGSQNNLVNRSTITQSNGPGEGDSHQLTGFLEWQHQHQRQPQPPQQTTTKVVVAQHLHEPEVEETMPQRCGLELELIDQGLQQSMASLEQALQQVRLEQRLLNHNRTIGSIEMERRNSKQSPLLTDINRSNSTIGSPRLMPSTSSIQRGVSLWSDVLNGHPNGTSDTSNNHLNGLDVIDARGIGACSSSGVETFPQGSSLFSIFGIGGLPTPMGTSNQIDCRLNTSSSVEGLLNSSEASGGVMTSAGSFDFPQSDFFRESLPAYPFSASLSTVAASSTLPKYSLYGHNQVDSEEICVVCLEQPAGVRLMACGHTSFCLDCVQGLINCPLCEEKVVGLHQCGHIGTSSRGGGPISSDNDFGNGGGYHALMQTKLDGSSYHLWNWVPGASV